MSYPNPAEAPSVTEEYSMPCAEALLASTLALMTGYVQACCDEHRDVMGHKIVANLQFLSESPLLTAHFRTLVGNLRGRWMQQVGMEDTEPQVPVAQRVLWHKAPDVVQ